MFRKTDILILSYDWGNIWYRTVMLLHKVLCTQWSSNHLPRIIMSKKTVRSPACSYKFKIISYKAVTQYLISVMMFKRHKNRAETIFISQMGKCNLSDTGLIFYSILHVPLVPTSTITQIICLFFSHER